MITIAQTRGAVFDVDETLLDTGASRNWEDSLHERSRLQAIHEMGKRHNIPALLSVTPTENTRSFKEAPVHTAEGAAWHTLFVTGVVQHDTPDPNNPLLREIITRKDELFEELLRTDGKPFPGAVAFVSWLAENGFKDHLAIASTSIRRDINTFLETSGLAQYFPQERIISKEDVTHPKPHPEAFDKAFLSLRLPDSARGNVLAFEDFPRGITSAKGAGLYTCAITTMFPRQAMLALDTPPDLIADSFDEFRQALEPVAV